MVAPYKNLYAVPKESFDAFIKHKTGSFPNVKSLKVNQLNFNDGNKIKPQHLGSDLHTNNISRARVNAGGQTSLSSTGGGGVEQLNLGDQSQHIPNTSARVNVGGQTSLSSTGDGGVEQVNLGNQSQPSNEQDQNNSSSVSFFDATGEPQEVPSRHIVDETSSFQDERDERRAQLENAASKLNTINDEVAVNDWLLNRKANEGEEFRVDRDRSSIFGNYDAAPENWGRNDPSTNFPLISPQRLQPIVNPPTSPLQTHPVDVSTFHTPTSVRHDSTKRKQPMVSTPHPSSYGNNPNYLDSPITRSPQFEAVSPPKKQLVQLPIKPRRPSISTAAFYGAPKPKDIETTKPVEISVPGAGKRRIKIAKRKLKSNSFINLRKKDNTTGIANKTTIGLSNKYLPQTPMSKSLGKVYGDNADTLLKQVLKKNVQQKQNTFVGSIRDAVTEGLKTFANDMRWLKRNIPRKMRELSNDPKNLTDAEYNSLLERSANVVKKRKPNLDYGTASHQDVMKAKKTFANQRVPIAKNNNVGLTGAVKRVLKRKPLSTSTIAARTRSRKKPITPIARRTRINMKKKTEQKKAWL